ncbi:MAG: ComEC/Rec2 family competence protein [Pseudomonadota bacterium]
MQKIQELIANYLSDAFIRQSHNSVIWIPFFLALGIGGYFSLKVEPHISYLILFLSISAALSVLLGSYRYRSMLVNYSFWSVLGLILVITGFIAATLRTQVAYTPMIEKKINYANVIGDIESIEPLEDGSRVLLSNLEIEDMAAPPRKIRIKMRQDAGLQAGQRISFLAGLNPPSPPVAPGAFDFQRWAYFQGIGAVGFSYGQPKIVDNAKASPITTAREYIKNNIIAQTDKPGQSVILALMTGQRKAIIEEDWQAMRNSGLAHMLAISGLHVGMVAGVLFFFSRLMMAAIEPLALRYPIKKYAAIIAISGAFFYMVMVGATIPTQRAMIMTALAMLAICLDRSPFSLRLVGIAAIIILLYRPESLVSVSFQMSFAAVTALVAFYEVTRKYWRRAYSRAGVIRKFALYFIGLSTTTIIAGTVTGLFALYHFNQYAMYGLLANLVAVPILSIIVMPLLVFSYVLMPIGLSSFTLALAEYGVEWILATAHWVANMDGAVFYLPSFPLWIFASMILSLWVFTIWKGPEKKAILPVFALLCVMVSLVQKPDI